MRKIKVLVVCGSGTVTSSMVSNKLKDKLEEKGYKIETTQTNPGGVQGALSMGNYDFIAYTSPVSGEPGIPTINANGFLTGFGEDEFLEEVMEVINNIE